MQKFEFNRENFLAALQTYHQQAKGYFRGNNPNETAQRILETINLTSKRVNDFNNLSPVEIRQILHQNHVFDFEILDHIFGAFQGLTVSNEPDSNLGKADPYFQPNFDFQNKYTDAVTSFCAFLFQDTQSQALQEAMTTLLNTQNNPKISAESNSELFAEIEKQLIDYFIIDSISPKEEKEKLFLKRLKQSFPQANDNHINNYLTAIRKYFNYIKQDSEKFNLMLNSAAFSFCKRHNTAVGHGLSWSFVRDPDIPKDAPYIDLASGILSLNQTNTFLSPYNERIFYLNDISSDVFSLYDAFQQAREIDLSSKVKYLRTNMKNFSQEFAAESVGTIRANNVISFCNPDVVMSLFEQAKKVLMPKGKLIFCLVHDETCTKSQDISIEDLFNSKYQIENFHTESAKVLMVKILLLQAKQNGWQIKIGSSHANDGVFHENRTGYYINGIVPKSTDIVLVKP